MAGIERTEGLNLHDDRRPWLIAIVASAGGVGALEHLLEALPNDFGAPIAVVIHLDPHHPSTLAQILDRRTGLEVRQAQDGDSLRAGVVYVAPPDRHLLVDSSGGLNLSTAEKVHYVRPSGDKLFESLAESCGSDAVAVVLTGSGTDGADGARAVAAAGGIVVAQDEASAQYPEMPRATIETGCVDHVADLDGIAELLVSLSAPSAPRR